MVLPSAGCAHIEAAVPVRTATERTCVDCAKTGDDWVTLRTCQSCGGTRCCDSSPNRHATAHHRASGHPVIASAEPGERWIYCYLDQATATY